MKASKLLLIGTVLLGFNAMADDSIIANIFVLNSNKHSVSSNNMVHSYLAKESTSTVITTMRGTGKFAGVNQTKNENKTTVVGVDVQGFSQIILSDAGNGRVSMKTDSNLSASDSDVSMNVNYKLDSEAVITQGSWQSYLQGEEIVFQLTEDSLREESNIAGQNLANSIENTLKKALSAQGLGSLSMKTKVSLKPQDSDSQICKATLATLDCFRAKQEYEITIKVSGL